MVDRYEQGMPRRRLLGLFGTAGAFGLVGCGDRGEARDHRLTRANTACLLVPELTEGPFFVDERLQRADITDGQPGLPLTLTIRVYNATSAACGALAGVQIDIWHANAGGAYSDIRREKFNNGGVSTAGETFLRGYQITDAQGKVLLTTIYPGWYPGRTPHIHLKARMVNASGRTTHEATTQIFFDDSITDRVYATQSPYNRRGARQVRNAQDGIYDGQTNLLLALTESNTTGYTGDIAIGIAV